MMYIRLLVVVAVTANTWLLNSAQFNHVQRYKRAIAQKADRLRVFLANEQCGSDGRLRQPHSVTRQHALGVFMGRHTKLRDSYQEQRPALETETRSQGCRPGTGHRSIQRLQDGIPSPRNIRVRNVQTTGARISPFSAWRFPDTKYGREQQTESGRGESNPQPKQPLRQRLHDELSARKRIPRSLSRTRTGQKLEVYPDGTLGSDKGYTDFQPIDYLAKSRYYTGFHEGKLWSTNVPDHVPVPPQWMTTMYFKGQKEQLKVHPAAGLVLPRAAFTLELWVKPEGGQGDPAVLAGVFDNCSHSLSEKGWSVGIRTVDPMKRRDARFFFTVRTDRAPKATTIRGHQHYQANYWTHLVVSYNGQKMSLYVDGAKVAESSEQSGNLYSHFMSACRIMLIGGDLSDNGHYFRGEIGKVVLWGSPQVQAILTKGHPQKNDEEPILAFRGTFSSQEWLPYKDNSHPVFNAVSVLNMDVVSPFLPPPCGVTVCDNKDIILSYTKNWQLRASKRIRYRVVNICNDDGGQPTVSQSQIQQQHLTLSEAFRAYNISWELIVHTVHNSSLRQRFILSNCQTNKIGNRHCDVECDHPITGHDGGDCLHLGPCYNWKRRDGVCDTECNSIRYDYDDGDCCDPEVTDVTKTCFDPESPERAYMSVKEVKDLLQLSSADTLNVFFANNSVREELAGAATWPWAKEALGHQGGMVLNPSYFGTAGHSKTMVHEMGHILGLYHVFKGVSERESCSDPCRETTASMETGDLCADTAPAPKSKACRDPDPVADTCGHASYRGTPYNNYMSYTDDNCTNSFTPNQVARMHCYIDLAYQNWVLNRKPSPIPLAPMVIGHSSDSVSVHWLPPVSGLLHQRNGTVNCRSCSVDGAFHQYAYKATSPRACDSSGYWTPEEAVGPPDVYQPCEPSLQAWSPELHLYDANMTSPCPKSEGCVLELYFLHHVVPESLTVWVTYTAISTQPIANIELITDSGETLHMGAQNVFCDMPFTMRLHVHKKISSVKIYTFDEKMEIDAVLLTSRPNNTVCADCQPLHYHVLREPPFQLGSVRQTDLIFTDTNLTKGVQYKYRVQVEADGVVSDPSPPLFYTLGSPFCGDGQQQGREQCDDGNLLDGDGCSKKCVVEPGFSCDGQPNLCHVLSGDDVCEEFEKASSARGCGFFTPLGYSDQWASEAWASHQDRWKCPAQVVTGEPVLTQECKSHYGDVDSELSQYTWFPCTAQLLNHYDQEQPVWLKVGFSQPRVAAAVIVYLASDGSWPGDQYRKTVTIQSSDTSGKNYYLGTHELSCHRNPLVVNMTHNISSPLFLTSVLLLNFSSPLVAVTGVALRTSYHFSALSPTGCEQQPCSVDSCSPLQVEHASVACSPGQYYVQCTVTCDQGYGVHLRRGRHLPSNQKEATLECVYGLWDRVVTCQLIDCGFPHESHIHFASFVCPDGTEYGKRCSFSCNPPAILQGANNWLVCLEDGLWSFPEAYCKIECPVPPKVPNAKLLALHCEGKRHDVGSICHYRCNPGHYVTNSLNAKLRRKFLKLECLVGGQWEEGHCDPVTCPSLPAVFSGMYTCTNHLEFDSVCTLQCPHPSEVYTVRCTKDGTWTAQLSVCVSMQGSCPPPHHENMVEYTCENGHGVGAVCYPACTMALSDPVLLPSGIISDTVKHWMLPSKVSSIVCTGKKTWFPHPKLVHCMQSCEPFAGDGWCDTINNRAYCQYDGGDCCPSTLSTKKVVQFGADCDEDECSCRDPDAEENQQLVKFLKPGLFKISRRDD